jgi:hypothetical protein
VSVLAAALTEELARPSQHRHEWVILADVTDTGRGSPGPPRPGTPLTCKDGRNPSGGPAAPSPTATPRSPIDWNAVGRAMGSPLRTEEGDVHTAEFLRSDLHVVNAGVTENPGMELGAEAMFHQTTPG